MEGAITFASLVVGVAVTQQLMNLHHLLRSRKDVRWDPICLLFALFVLMTLVMLWWGVARGLTGQITIGDFLPILFTLIIAFLLASASLPDAASEHPYDLRKFWEGEARYLWTMLLILIGFGVVLDVGSAVANGQNLPEYLWQRNIDLTIFALLFVPVFFRKRWIDAVMLAILSVGPLTWLSRSIG